MTHFEDIFRKHYGYLLGVANNMLHDPDESRDVVSETFATMWEQGRELHPNTARQYLAVCVRNSCLKRIARLQLRERVARLYPIELSLFATDIDREARVQQIEQAIETQLDDYTRTIFKMCYLDKKAHREVAQCLGISIKAVDKRIGKALCILRETLNPKQQ